MEHYVTLFDSLFLPQGLALYLSMERYIKNYNLWVLCIDDTTFDVLKKLHLPNVSLIRLSDVETPQLKKVKLERTQGEYCWTLTPFTPGFVFELDTSIQRVTYVDADIWFLKSPQPIFDEFELSRKDVLITDHAYAPEYDQSSLSGYYCVQFIIFNRFGAEKIRSTWEKECLDWCYSRSEDGKFGDQKYLDNWPEKFKENVHVLSNKEWMLAPWNISRFPYGNAIIYHFHGLRVLNTNHVYLSTYKIPFNVLKYIYNPYLENLSDARKILKEVGFSIRKQQSLQKGFKFLLLTLASSLFAKMKTFYKRHYSSF